MTVPPASVRSVRPCRDCTHWGSGDDNEYCESCKLDKGKKNPQNNDIYRYMGEVNLSEWPCDYHFTPEEIVELIDQHHLHERYPLTPETGARIREIIDKLKQEQP